MPAIRRLLPKKEARKHCLQKHASRAGPNAPHCHDSGPLLVASFSCQLHIGLALNEALQVFVRVP
eukprot:4140560-Alexandrium_andersonii.AAC.1